jgi:hypothetical protein
VCVQHDRGNGTAPICLGDDALSLSVARQQLCQPTLAKRGRAGHSGATQQGSGAPVRKLCTAILAFAFALAVGRCGPASAQAVDLQLVLTVDTSGSVSEQRFQLQKQGYVAAFRSPRLLQAIASGATRAIAVTMTQWTGPVLQIQVVPWMRIDSEASMHAFADAIDKAPRQLFGGGTSISGAIDHAMTLFPKTELQGARRVIDVSGDGANNRGRPSAEARDEAVRAGATINGLPILALEPWLDRYYWDNVVGGPGAFVISAESYETFADAVLKKLVIEIAAVPLPLHSAKFHRGAQ